MKQAIRVRGWISTASLINPRKLFTDELPRYYLAINPESAMVFDEPQKQVDQQKREAETPYSSMEDLPLDEIEKYEISILQQKIYKNTDLKLEIDGNFEREKFKFNKDTMRIEMIAKSLNFQRDGKHQEGTRISRFM